MQATPPPSPAATTPNPVALEDQARILAEEVPHQIERLKWLASHDKICWGTYQIRKRALLAAVATLRGLAGGAA